MKLLFVADPLESFKIYKDSTFAMMREAARRGHTLWATQPVHLGWQRGGRVQARALPLTLTGVEGHGHEAWYTTTGPETVVLAEFDAVLMRKDPPFDTEYFYATHLLSHAERDGATVLNSPAALRDHPEKLAILEFPQFIAPTLVTRSAADVRAFHAEHRDIILKPLDGMGGMGIFRVKDDGLNLGSIVETLNGDGAQTLMVQKFVPQIVDGDKRVLVIARKAGRSAATWPPAASAWRVPSPIASARSPASSAPSSRRAG
jgi:glutathione synthase